MEIKFKIAEEEDSKLWDEIVASSPHGTMFHIWKWLKIIERNAKLKLYPLIIYKDNTIVGIYPIFLQKKDFVYIAYSPNRSSYVLYLGPLIHNYENLKQDKKEAAFLLLQEEIDRILFSEFKCKFVQISSSPGLSDCRAFKWCGYQVEPRYTYRVDLSKGPDYVWERFDRKLRVDINRAVREGVEVEEGNKDDLEFIHSSIHRRFKEQGLGAIDNYKYLLELYEEFYPKNMMKIFIAKYKGKRVAGVIYLLHGNIIYLWEGITKIDLKGIAPNDMIQWTVIKWACNNGFDYYEIMEGGNVRRLRNFKSKYNPEPMIWFTSVKYSSNIYKSLFVIYTVVQAKLQILKQRLQVPKS